MSYKFKRRINNLIASALQETAKEIPNWQNVKEWLELAMEQSEKAREEEHGTENK